MLFLRGGPVAPHSAWAGVGWWVNTVKDPVASAICHAAAIWQFCSKIPRPRKIAAWASRGNLQEGSCAAEVEACDGKGRTTQHKSISQPASQPTAQPAGQTATHLVLGSAVAGEAAKVEARRRPTEINRAVRLCGDAHCRVYHVD